MRHSCVCRTGLRLDDEAVAYTPSEMMQRDAMLGIKEDSKAEKTINNPGVGDSPSGFCCLLVENKLW
jgi:hypothetical protein